MQRRYNLAHLILASVIVLGLTPMMVVVEAQAQIAFQSNRDRNYEIYVMDDDRKNPRNLTNHPDSDLAPSWSPYGTRIAFMSNRDGHVRMGGGLPTFEVYVMDADGGNQQNLTNDPNSDLSPSWSPDGKRIAFVSYRDGKVHAIHGWPTSEIYVMDADGGNQQRLTENRDWDYAPSWSPDGKRIAFSSDGDNNQADIYVMDADGGNQQKITNHPRDDGSPAWFVPAFAVAPAGKKFTMWGRLKQVNQ